MVRIIICIGGPLHKIRKVAVGSSDRVSNLNCLFQNEVLDYLYSGQVLSPHRSFDFYGIDNGSFITVIPASNNVANLGTWTAITRDSEFMGEMLYFATNESTKAELARLKDLRMTRLENKNIKLNDINYQSQRQGVNRRQNEYKTCLSEKGNGPNCDPLPYYWNNQRIGVSC